VKQFRIFDRNVQTEAILNEFKGNLFEYLVGARLARLYDIESDFMNHLPTSKREQLASYESYLREHAKDLLVALPKLAEVAALSVEEKLVSRPKEVVLLGKIEGGSEKREWGEADLLLKLENGNSLPLSLKLCRINSYVNTKSGGIRTFIAKYFVLFSEAIEAQEFLNKEVDLAFAKMANELHLLADLDYSGTFGASWDEVGLSHLPGELPALMRPVLGRYYNEIAQALYKIFMDFKGRDEKRFFASLAALCGQSIEGLWQVLCFHSDEGEKSHALRAVHILESEFFEEGRDKIEFISARDVAHFTIRFPKFDLQIRAKPMNKFTVPSVKVNCSLKFRF
jgi:hypothetical protein